MNIIIQNEQKNYYSGRLLVKTADNVFFLNWKRLVLEFKQKLKKYIKIIEITKN